MQLFNKLRGFFNYYGNDSCIDLPALAIKGDVITLVEISSGERRTHAGQDQF